MKLIWLNFLSLLPLHTTAQNLQHSTFQTPRCSKPQTDPNNSMTDQPWVYMPMGSGTWLNFPDNKLNYEEAEMFCKDLTGNPNQKGHLAHILNDQENAFISQYLRYDNTWISGFYFPYDNGRWSYYGGHYWISDVTFNNNNGFNLPFSASNDSNIPDPNDYPEMTRMTYFNWDDGQPSISRSKWGITINGPNHTTGKFSKWQSQIYYDFSEFRAVCEYRCSIDDSYLFASSSKWKKAQAKLGDINFINNKKNSKRPEKIQNYSIQVDYYFDQDMIHPLNDSSTSEYSKISFGLVNTNKNTDSHVRCKGPKINLYHKETLLNKKSFLTGTLLNSAGCKSKFTLDIDNFKVKSIFDKKNANQLKILRSDSFPEMQIFINNFLIGELNDGHWSQTAAIDRFFYFNRCKDDHTPVFTREDNNDCYTYEILAGMPEIETSVVRPVGYYRDFIVGYFE